MKISYIITTIRTFEMASQTILSIKNLDDHDYEILLISPNNFYNECKNIDKLSFIQDNTQNIGSVYTNNAACKWSTGDWLCFLPDDFYLVNLDINKFQEFLEGPTMKKKTFKMFSMAPRSCHLVPGQEIYKIPINSPYQVMHFPCVARETIETKLDGVIFNDRFKHHCCDHWLGFYAAQHEEYKPYDYSIFNENGPTLIVPSLRIGNITNHSFTNYDYNIADQLYKEFLINPNINYNF